MADASCPRCGVVFAKLRDGAAPPPLRREPAPPEEPARGSPPWKLIGGGLAGVALLLAGLQVIRPRAAAPSRSEEAQALPAEAAEAADFPAPVAPVTIVPSAVPSGVELTDGLSAEERQRITELVRRFNARQPLGPQDITSAEALLAAHPSEPGLRGLLMGVLTQAASGERQRRNLEGAARHLERAAALEPGSLPTWLALFQVRREAEDWSGAEAAARGVLAVDPGHADGLAALGYALYRQDRNREAADVLRAALEVREDAQVSALLQRIVKGLSDESRMTEQQLAHFHVRYDGEEHQAVGREILRALERHYATLATTLDHQPTATIPVILFGSQAYYDASGAPAWSGGVYDTMDGRIRIPIGGLTASLTPEMDETLIHELTHAFVADRTRGAAPREIHEGLAQYMEGKRSESQLGREGLQALAADRIGGVMGFYISALSFVEYLMAQRGMGGMNDLLRAMGETGNVDEAFKRVHGQGYTASQQAWRQRLKQQAGI